MVVEGWCTRGTCRLFGGSTSGYLQMKGHKCGTVEESSGKEWPGEIAGMSKFILEESWGGERDREGKLVSWVRRKDDRGDGGVAVMAVGSLSAYNSITRGELLF